MLVLYARRNTDAFTLCNILNSINHPNLKFLIHCMKLFRSRAQRKYKYPLNLSPNHSRAIIHTFCLVVTNACKYTNIHTRTHTHTHTHTHAHKHTHTHTHARTHARTHTHTRARVRELQRAVFAVLMLCFHTTISYLI